MFLEVTDLGLSDSSAEDRSDSKLLIPAAAFHASRNELQAYKEALDQNTIVSVTNTSGRITYTNEKFCKIIGYHYNKLVGMKISMLNSGFHNIEFKEGLHSKNCSGLPFQRTVLGLF
ncbi:MAG: PAS domain-containing protein [Hoeflea sp.]|uniref:PAS domain-containing protein n=1 Tax=Hoeflea sp. TaxID=1940281 RepID=UPI001D490B08|nr:PAS domain-containing protein [Hoeflea sp.]MBU4529399.1 PAS domain-containing protein [Alphaproteobacteria bacterium]MBU4542306.1 PAS domain-containing protein [Alphaproteobacteria bacterium]MBU4548437.1 PAS domain-containing protein [Alphaproteobacteria bacterium]MBV1723317.1 PAS domain-containing protein [Hoeflea sp.]MBV1760006.1 PAS domain-containing protein [Hoeflea sp.]